MKSKVHPTYKTHYRVGNWQVYERALVRRGDVTLWLSPEATAAWGVRPTGRPGGQRRFSDLAIETALTLRLVFRLPLRQTEGFVRSILSAMRVGLEAPDHTTLSRRSQVLRVAVHAIRANGAVHLLRNNGGRNECESECGGLRMESLLETITVTGLVREKDRLVIRLPPPRPISRRRAGGDQVVHHAREFVRRRGDRLGAAKLGGHPSRVGAQRGATALHRLR